MTDPVLLAGGLARRLAHDLANPLAALQTVVELMGDDPLARAALAETSGRLALFRALFGGDPDHESPQAEALLSDRLAADGRRLEVELGADAPPRLRRAGLALVLALADRMTGPGSLRIGAAAGKPVAEALGRVRAPDEALAAALRGSAPGNPNEAPAAYAAALAGPLCAVPTAGGLRIGPAGLDGKTASD